MAAGHAATTHACARNANGAHAGPAPRARRKRRRPGPSRALSPAVSPQVLHRHQRSILAARAAAQASVHRCPPLHGLGLGAGLRAQRAQQLSSQGQLRAVRAQARHAAGSQLLGMDLLVDSATTAGTECSNVGRGGPCTLPLQHIAAHSRARTRQNTAGRTQQAQHAQQAQHRHAPAAGRAPAPAAAPPCLPPAAPAAGQGPAVSSTCFPRLRRRCCSSAPQLAQPWLQTQHSQHQGKQVQQGALRQ